MCTKGTRFFIDSQVFPDNRQPDHTTVSPQLKLSALLQYRTNAYGQSTQRTITRRVSQRVKLDSETQMLGPDIQHE